MKSKIVRIIIITFIALFSFTAVSCSCKKGCKKDDGGKAGKTYNNEVDKLVLSTQELDGLFNPFFSTSATDSSVVGMTQLGMISNDEFGRPSFGENEACVTLNYEARQNKVGNEIESTTYYFVLKNNVKFSNGSRLSIKDVLFNLYVYLDPVYSGSSTIYSTEIEGLQEYRTQSTTEEEQKNFNKRFEIEADARLSALLDASSDIFKEDKYANVDATEFRELLENEYKYSDTIVDDFDSTLKLFKEELATDYANNAEGYQDIVFYTGKGDAKREYKNLIQSEVEAFLFAEGYIKWNSKDAKLEYDLGESFSTSFRGIASNDTAKKEQAKQKAIETVFEDKFPRKIEEILLYWQTATNLYDQLVAQAMGEYYKDPSTKKIPNISGIKFANKDESVQVNNTTYAKAEYDENGELVDGSYEVLSIKIKKVDPKAIWNFSFAVAPMYYYSDQKHIDAFDFEKNFGVEYGNFDFFEDVIKSEDKNGVPVGAGPYAASSTDGGTANVTKNDFWNNNVVYFERNPYFLMGSPKIKTIRFQVIPQNQLTSSLYTAQIDFAEPNAKPELITELNSHKKDGIQNKSVRTSGYGYIGINAGKVSSIYVRQAIMHAINTQECVDYYKTTAVPIYRSMSKTSWAYPQESTPYYPYIGGPVPADLSVVNPDYADFVRLKGKQTGDVFTVAEQNEFIRYLVEDLAEYSLDANGVYAKSGDVLKMTFTIAGEVADHPAWQAMFHASEILNNVAGDGKGFQIDVRTDSNALKKLAEGGLTVWAAAWGSTIDPDMYQVYHRDSNASSTLNWGYKQIKQNTGGKYDTEVELVDQLSDLIDAAREILDENQRALIYAQALTIVMKLAVELPTYQRDDLFAYNVNKIDESSLFQNVSSFKGLTSEMWNITFKER